MKYYKAISEAIKEEMERDPRVVLFGVDVAREGGVFAQSRGLVDQFGSQRVRDTPISELGMVGAAVGAAMTGLRPIVDILFFDFIALALDQVANQAAKMRYMTAGGFGVPMTLLTVTGAGMNYGPQHSQHLEAWLGHIPGIRVAIPATSGDMKAFIKAAVRSEDPAIVIESLALWHDRGPVGGPDDIARFGEAAVVRSGHDISIISVGRMLSIALEGAQKLSEAGIEGEVVDVRSISPLDHDTICESVQKTHAAIVVHEAVVPFGVGAEIAAVIQAEVFEHLDAPVIRLGTPFTHIPASARLENIRIPSSESVFESAMSIRGGKR